MSLVTARSKTTGNSRLIPEHWLTHPVLGQKWEQTADQKAEADEIAGPDDSWTVAAMREWAGPRGIDLTGLRSHADILAAVTPTPTDPDTGSGDNAGTES